MELVYLFSNKKECWLLVCAIERHYLCNDSILLGGGIIKCECEPDSTACTSNTTLVFTLFILSFTL